jgi:sodium-dependent dicarboxylate transporter 2/3/5
MTSLSSIIANRRQISIVGGLVAFVLIMWVLPIAPEQPGARMTLAVAVLMAVLWITEAIPLAVTALFPIALFPILGIMKGRDVAPLYLNNILFLFMGGFMLALAMERWNLHRRIALKVILSIGSGPSRLLLGFMAGSWVLSMWISNTATTMMMVPIVMALLVRLRESAGESFRKLEIALLLGIAYASSVGGMATLIGTAPNLSFVRIYSISFPEASEITFLHWLGVGLPTSALLFVIIFLLLRGLFTRHVRFEMEPTVLQDEYRSLGRASYEEKVVLTAFSAMALLLVTRSSITINSTTIHGWSSLFPDPSFIDDGTVAITVALVLFLIPSRSQGKFIIGPGIIGKLPWDILILLGGGFALAKGFQDSGLSAYLGGQLAALQALPPLVVVLAVCALITFLTELTSNTATTQVVLPIIASLSTVVGLSPLLLMIPATIAASCAFMLPVATPPNAIVFGTHRLKVTDMARVGFWLNLIAIVTVTAVVYLIVSVFF